MVRLRTPINFVTLRLCSPALPRFTAAVVTSRGRPSEADTAALLQAGYGKQQVLEVVLVVGMKTLSNYTNHIADTPPDQAFGRAAWSKAA